MKFRKIKGGTVTRGFLTTLLCTKSKVVASQRDTPCCSGQPPRPCAEDTVIHPQWLSASLPGSKSSKCRRYCLLAPELSAAFPAGVQGALTWGAELVPEAMPGASHPKTILLQKFAQDRQRTWGPPVSHWSHLFKTSPSFDYCFHSNLEPVTPRSTYPREEASWFQKSVVTAEWPSSLWGQWTCRVWDGSRFDLELGWVGLGWVYLR